MAETDVAPTALFRPAPAPRRGRTAGAVLLVGVGLVAVFFAAVFIVRYRDLSELFDDQLARGRAAATAGDDTEARSLIGSADRTLDLVVEVRNLAASSVLVALATLGPGLVLTASLYRRAVLARAPRRGMGPASTVRPGADVFVSYAREDQAFVRLLVEHLARRGRETWVDWQGIPPTVDWMGEIHRAIASAGTMLFVITPASVRSPVCRAEAEYAAALGKRIVPVRRAEVPDAAIPPRLAALNWISFGRHDDERAALGRVDQALDLDIDWVRFHTRLLVRAREWQANATDPSYLLVGTDLEEARARLSGADGRAPRITTLQAAYVSASDDNHLARRRREVRGFYVASLVFGLLQPAVTYAFAFDEISESGLLALAPLWILALAFGGSGLLLRRPTLRVSVVIAAAAAVLMVVLYLTVWPLL